MPTFNCYRGDVDNTAITEDGSFIVKDLNGANWICSPVEDDPTGMAGFESALRMLSAQKTAHQAGVSGSGTELRCLNCNIEELPSQLASA